MKYFKKVFILLLILTIFCLVAMTGCGSGNKEGYSAFDYYFTPEG